MAKKKNITLKEFIEEGVAKLGVDGFKWQFGVTEGCVNHWRRSVSLPRYEQMVQIHKLSKGRVSYEEMITTWVRIRAKRRTKLKQIGRTK